MCNGPKLHAAVETALFVHDLSRDVSDGSAGHSDGRTVARLRKSISSAVALRTPGGSQPMRAATRWNHFSLDLESSDST